MVVVLGGIVYAFVLGLSMGMEHGACISLYIVEIDS